MAHPVGSYNFKIKMKNIIQNKTIGIRSVKVTSVTLRQHVLRFINSLKNTHSLLGLHIKFIIKNEGFKSLGVRYIVDINNKHEVQSYLSYIGNRFSKEFSLAYTATDIQNIEAICIEYIECERLEHKAFISRLGKKTLYNEIDIGIKGLHQIPFNNIYSSWGDVEIISADTYEIRNLRFNPEIEFIRIVESVSFDKIVYGTVTFKNIDNKAFMFTDQYTKDGNIKRTINMQDKQNNVYVFNPHTQSPSLFLDFNVLEKKYNYKKDKKGNIIKVERTNIVTPVDNYEAKFKKALAKGKVYEEPKLKALTLDIETYLEEVIDENNKKSLRHRILAICFFDGKFTHKFYRGDYQSDTMLLTQCFNKLLVEYNNNYNVYIHNGSNFDLIFLVEYLLNRNGVTVKPLYKNDKFLSLEIFFEIDKGDDKKEVCKIYIKDSMLLLLSSLAKLGKAFNVETQKDIFPYNFPNKNNLKYIGEVPSYEYFDSKKVSLELYNEYKSRYSLWKLRDVVLDYCSKDCISLYQIISKFKDEVDIQFQVNIQDCPTITSLAFKIFKANYYDVENNPIPLLNREIYNDLKEWYFGGHVDMYIPSGLTENGSLSEILNKLNSLEDKSPENIKKLFKTIKSYDVNSLYPAQMDENTHVISV